MDKIQSKIAALFDGDNAESGLCEQILKEISKYGRVTIKRIYGDWTNPYMKSWREQVNKHAIRPIQKFTYTTGKNSTDTALIIDAMDILHSKAVNGFCIVSSDSDYTGLAHRIREEGLYIIGIGRSQTPEAFVKACDYFIYFEKLKQVAQESKQKIIGKKTSSPKAKKLQKPKIGNSKFN
ncbi:MAG: NYN domain-containing protein [Bacteroidetes bacterium]|nr:NYN domain-containing protein [Bacteroidota bacterium]